MSGIAQTTRPKHHLELGQRLCRRIVFTRQVIIMLDPLIAHRNPFTSKIAFCGYFFSVKINNFFLLEHSQHLLMIMDFSLLPHTTPRQTTESFLFWHWPDFELNYVKGLQVIIWRFRLCVSEHKL